MGARRVPSAKQRAGPCVDAPAPCPQPVDLQLVRNSTLSCVPAVTNTELTGYRRRTLGTFICSSIRAVTNTERSQVRAARSLVHSHRFGSTVPLMANEDQAKIWNDVVGGAWVDHADDYDALLERFGLAAIDRLAPAPGERNPRHRVWHRSHDPHLGGSGRPGTVLGVDLSATMLTEAQRRARQDGVTGADFRQVDVQTGDLGHGDFDAAFSRVGVMFFEDPAAAFANVAGA